MVPQFIKLCIIIFLKIYFWDYVLVEVIVIGQFFTRTSRVPPTSRLSSPPFRVRVLAPSGWKPGPHGSSQIVAVPVFCPPPQPETFT